MIRMTFFIISDQYADSLVSQVSSMKHIWSIHVCSTSNLTEIMQQNFSYLRMVGTNDFAFKEEEEGMTTDNSFWPERIDFLDFLCCLPNLVNYFQRCIDYLTQFYQGNPSQLAMVNIFRRTYRAEEAIQYPSVVSLCFSHQRSSKSITE